jgi:hypothetical protein
LVNSGISITKERPKIVLDNLFSGTKHKPTKPLRTIEEKEEEAMEQAMPPWLKHWRVSGWMMVLSRLAQMRNISEPLGRFLVDFRPYIVTK